MKHTTISMLTPELGRCPAYDRFYRTSSMLIITNVVTHHLVHEVPEAHLADLLTEVVRRRNLTMLGRGRCMPR